MRRASFFSLLFIVCTAAFWVSVPSGCANIIPPQGGPRDSVPPVLLSVSPKDSTLNFRGDRIVFTFDEYIDDPQDLQNNLLFTPTFEINPEIAIRAKTMTLRFRDTLLPNTTYTLNFGNAIKDMNEGNVLRNFVYTFSTGSVLDSLSLSGKVILAQNGRTDSTLTVMLHSNLSDSAVRKLRPLYIARVQSDGSFRFRNLPQGSFAIYALGEAGLLRQYQKNTQLFAFTDSTVTPGITKDITLYAYREEAKQRPNSTSLPGVRTPGNDKRLRFTEPSGTQDLRADYVLNFQSPLRRFDSALISLTTDTTFTPAAYTALIDSSKTALRIRSTWKQGTRYNLILNKEFAEDSSGRKLLKTDTVSFNVKKLSDYGQLRVRVRNVDASRNPVLQFVQADAVVFSAPLNGGIFSSNLFNPGEYDLRILYDANGNGKWDPGQFTATKKQPEIAMPIERKLIVKAGLENEFDISL